ncbi:MAG TPA: hypothetical protein VH394_26290 [Thermoanaerobaculia bacterium]|nr:hypothetical protein [Thermoanaerobaculia bacterium]
MREPDIRAVEMVRSIREAHYEQVKGLSPQEKIAFFREKARRLHSELGKPAELQFRSGFKTRSS